MNPIPPGALLLAFAATLGAHPGSGIAVDEQGRVLITAGPHIVLVETNGKARFLVSDRAHEKFYQLHHLQRAPGGGWVTASDMGTALWHFTHEGALTRYFPPPNDDRALRVGLGGDPFALDAEGNVYAVNSVQDRFTQILKVTREGRIHTLAGGDWGYADGAGAAARFGNLHSATFLVVANGTLLLTDDGCRVRRVTPEGNVSTLAGGREAGYVDGPGAGARFEGAHGLAMDREGHVLVAESAESGGRIRRIGPDGTVRTLAGGRRGRSRDGAVAEAAFQGPTGLAVGGSGDVYVLEPDGPRVRRLAGGQVTTLLKGLPGE